MNEASSLCARLAAIPSLGEVVRRSHATLDASIGRGKCGTLQFREPTRWACHQLVLASTAFWANFVRHNRLRNDQRQAPCSRPLSYDFSRVVGGSQVRHRMAPGAARRARQPGQGQHQGWRWAPVVRAGPKAVAANMTPRDSATFVGPILRNATCNRDGWPFPSALRRAHRRPRRLPSTLPGSGHSLPIFPPRPEPGGRPRARRRGPGPSRRG